MAEADRAGERPARQFQLRLVLADDAAAAARAHRLEGPLAPLAGILERHGARLQCQLDAFRDYCAGMEGSGRGDDPLVAWTRDILARPEKRERYRRRFTLRVDGCEVYPEDRADALEAALRPLVGAGPVLSLTRHDTDPANNPQIPRRYRRPG